MYSVERSAALLCFQLEHAGRCCCWTLAINSNDLYVATRNVTTATTHVASGNVTTRPMLQVGT